MAKRCIFLAGAPDFDALNWDESDLFHSFDEPVRRFMNGEIQIISQNSEAVPIGLQAKWRSVPMKGSVPWNDVDFLESGGDLLSFRDASSLRQKVGEDVDFLEHSMAVLDNLDSSQLVTSTAMDGNQDQAGDESTYVSFATTDMTSTSIQTSDASFTTTSSSNPTALPPLKPSGPIADLKRLPNADHITRIQPQTITVNLLTGIITVSPARTVRLRRRNAEMDIIELTVGDETRAGFTISFWLVPVESQRKPSDDLRETLSKLRIGDVVLLENVALSCFRGNVYGQSLSKRFARNSTGVTVLKDGKGKGIDSAFAGKWERVRQWASDFVGVSRRKSASFVVESNGRVRKRRKVEEALPPDTPG